jgi:prepilin signal peptidase PulO-like enzyme (type II secretory pathway)
MPALSVLTISAIVCAAFVTGLLLLPFLAHRMLIRKYRQVADCEPELEKMSELGMIPHTKGSMRTFCDPLPYAWRVLCACASALMAGVFALWSSHAFAALFAWLALCFCIVMSLVDARARILPYEMTITLIPIALCFQALLVSAGFVTIARVIEGAALYCLVLFGSAGIAQAATKKPALGQGDIRAVPGFALLCAASPFEALATAAMSIGVAFIIFRLCNAESLSESAPFGPFLTLGAAVAMISCMASPA